MSAPRDWRRCAPPAETAIGYSRALTLGAEDRTIGSRPTSCRDRRCPRDGRRRGCGRLQGRDRSRHCAHTQSNHVRHSPLESLLALALPWPVLWSPCATVSIPIRTSARQNHPVRVRLRSWLNDKNVTHVRAGHPHIAGTGNRSALELPRMVRLQVRGPGDAHTGKLCSEGIVRRAVLFGGTVTANACSHSTATRSEQSQASPVILDQPLTRCSSDRRFNLSIT